MKKFLLILLFYSHCVFARPISYSGGYTAMQMNDLNKNSLHLHYSPTYKYSVGYKGEYWRDEKWQFHGVQLNYLVNRTNKKASQANFYLKTGAGIAYSDFERFNGKTQEAGFAGIALDWENRRYFASYENRAYYAGTIDKFFTQSARIGIAPYIRNYGSLHSWIMLQADHNPTKKDNLLFTPLLRFFKSDYMIETGVSEKGDFLFNWIIRF